MRKGKGQVRVDDVLGKYDFVGVLEQVEDSMVVLLKAGRGKKGKKKRKGADDGLMLPSMGTRALSLANPTKT